MSASSITTFADPVPEGHAKTFTVTLKYSDGSLVPGADISSISMSLLNKAGTVVNSRNAVSVKNINGGTMHATAGTFTMVFNANDHLIEDETNAFEYRRAIFVFSTASGQAVKAIEYAIENMRTL